LRRNSRKRRRNGSVQNWLDSLKKKITNPVNVIRETPVDVGVKPDNNVSLTEEQKECVNYKTEGTLLVQGIPGSGKSTVLLERAKFLQKKGEGKVLVLTYNRSLAIYMRQLALKTSSNPFEATTFHQWGRQLLLDAGIPNLNYEQDLRGLVHFALNTVRKEETNLELPKIGKKNPQAEKWALVDFLQKEFSWIKGNGIKGLQEYLDVTRTGRGKQVQVLKGHREGIFKVFSKYQEMLRSRRRIDYDDIALLLLANFDKINRKELPAHILVDEAQDLSLMELTAIRKLALKSLTIAADKGQRIYRRNFTWKQANIDVRGRSRMLLNTFRSTKQIIQLARSLQRNDQILMKDAEYVPPEDPKTEGPVPELYVSRNRTEELKTVLDCIKKIRSSLPQHTIGVIGHSVERLKEFEEALDEEKIPFVSVKEDGADILSPGVKLTTYYASKGLEFDHVIVTGLKRGFMPFGQVPPGEDEEEFISTERRKLYVAMTRAKKHLILSAIEKVSPFIDELDHNLYIKKKM
jgi:superfamily I DNA/RNA helicase